MPTALRTRIEQASLLDLAIVTSLLATLTFNLIAASDTLLAAAQFVPTYH